MSWFNPQNPGIDGIDELTPAEELLLTSLAGNNFVTGDIIYFDGTILKRLGIGSTGQVLKVSGGLPVWGTDNTGGGGGGGGTVDTIVAGTGISVDSTDPANPIVSSTITQYTDELAQDAIGTILVDSSEIDFTYNDSTPSITASIISGSIDETKLDTSVNNSLDLADSSVQPGDNITDLVNNAGYITDITGEVLNDLSDVIITSISSGEILKFNGTNWINNTLAEANISELGHTHTASEITDFDTEVSNNSDVSANTAARHTAVTVTDTDDIDHTLTVQALSSALKATAISAKTLKSSLAGTEEVLINDAGTLKKTTAQDIANLGGGGGYTDEQAQDAVGNILVDSSEIDFTYNDGTPSITASIVSGSIDESKLDTSVNASLDLADSALQSSAIGVSIQAYDADLSSIAGLTPSDDDFIQRKSGAWTNRTISQVKTDLGLSGTNSGDQTSIVGITGTKAQFDTAVTDGNFMYIGDAPTAHTHTKSDLTDIADFLLESEVDIDIKTLSLPANTTISTFGASLVDDVDASGVLGTLGITSTVTELNYTDGVTSNIQTQIDAKPTISSGAGAPASTPTKVGDIYIDTTGDDAYIAVGTASSADWEKSNDGTGGGGVSDGDKGDISVSSSGTVWTIDNDVVTYAKIQNVSATDKILGRSSAGAGDVEEITCTSFARSILDDADEATFKATVNLEIGTDVQAYDADLSAIAGLSPSNDDFLQRKSGAWTNRTLAQVKTDLGLPQKLILSSGQGTSSTSLSDVTGLVFSVSANKTYMFDFQVYYTSNVSTEGLGLGVNAPTGATITYAVQIISSTAGAGRFESATAADTKIQHTTGSTGGAYACVRGMVEVAGTAGNLALRFATETGGANSNTIGAGSFGVLTEVV